MPSCDRAMAKRFHPTSDLFFTPNGFTMVCRFAPADCDVGAAVGAARDQERQQPGVVVVHGQVDRRPAGGLGVHIRALVDQLAYPLVIGGEDVGVYRPVVAAREPHCP